jgi:two-component sensor histidine kinase
MNKLILTIFPVVIFLASHGQEVSKRQADSLILSLRKSISDVDRMHTFTTLAEYYIRKPGELKADLDSGAVFIKSARQLNSKVRSIEADGFQMLLESMLARERKQSGMAKDINEKAIEVLKTTRNKAHLARAYFELASFYDYNDSKQMVDKIRLVELAAELYEQSTDTLRLASTLQYLADLYQINGRDAEALQVLDRALTAYQSIHYTKLYGIYVLYGKGHYNAGNYKKSLSYELMALKSAENEGDTSMSLCQINNSIGVTLVQLQDGERAMGYYKTALNIADKYNDETNFLLLMNNIVINYIRLKKYDSALVFMNELPKKYLAATSGKSRFFILYAYACIHNYLKNYPEFTFYANKLLDLIKVYKPHDNYLNDFYLLLTRFYIKTGQYVAAENYARELKFLSMRIGDPDRIKEYYFIMFRLDTARGRYKSAVNNLIEYKTRNDSLYNEASSRQIKQLAVEFETEKKENEIKIKNQELIVLNQSNLLQKSNLKQAMTTRNITFAGIAVLCIVLVMLYWQFRLKQTTNFIISHKNSQLQHLLTEKEWLLKEIHHRVKNNLQIVMSLLNSQSAYIDNEPALTAIHNSQHRVHAMSLIHQKLYSSENLSTIDMSLYIREMVSYLADSFDTGQRIRFEFNIEPLEMDVSQAVPMGLILNEAITNSIKYAFPDGKNGVISISLSSTSPYRYLLIISDNGIGLPVDCKKTGSLGMSLMRGLSEDIDGNFSIESNKGTIIKVSFEQDISVKKPNALTASFVINN